MSIGDSVVSLATPDAERVNTNWLAPPDGKRDASGECSLR